ncbi:MAG TPA: GNAT family N-acetyltransferase [Candidatus Dorea intestinavium]|nr:GNAT family N-acetyltransferase [Candidatus Dorea intestinavium]
MRIERIEEDKDNFIDILFLGEENEEKIRKYLDKGDLYALYDDEVLRTLCIVVMLNNRKCELKELVTIEEDRGQGYGSYMLEYVSQIYSSSCDVMYVASPNNPKALGFYTERGFLNAHVNPSFFAKYYEQAEKVIAQELGKVIYLKKLLESEVNVKRVVDLALKAGEMLLQSGGEIFRVEETITRICNRFYVDKIDIFVLSHGIFISARNGENDAYTRVRDVPLAAADLSVVTAINDLSRNISSGEISLDEAFESLDKIEKWKGPNPKMLIVSSGLGSAFFGYLLGANLKESICALFIGMVMYIWVIYAKNHGVTKIIVNIIAGMIITILALACTYLPISGMQIGGMIIGAIMPLVPGLAFVNAIRDIADSDFISGIVRMIDALLVFGYIAIGVGVTLAIYNNFMGGILL